MKLQFNVDVLDQMKINLMGGKKCLVLHDYSGAFILQGASVRTVRSLKLLSEPINTHLVKLPKHNTISSLLQWLL